MGFVYFIWAGEVHRIKIGWAIDPLKRFRLLQTASPVRLELLGVVSGTCEAERQLHRKFRRLRELGEWFRDEPTLMRYVARIASRVTQEMIDEARQDTADRAEFEAWSQTEEGRTEFERDQRIHRRVTLRRGAAALRAALDAQSVDVADKVAAARKAKEEKGG